MSSPRSRSLDAVAFEEAGRALLGAVTGGGSWTDALDALMPRIGCVGGNLAGVMPPRLFGVPSRDVTEIFDAIAAGRTPPLTKLTRMLPGPQDGFVCDQMDAFRDARLRDGFYRDFIRPSGLAYQASAYLDGTGDDVVNLMVFRGDGSGGFDPNELRDFSVFLPYVRAAAMASRTRLQAEADRCAAPFAGRGDPVLNVGFDGKIRDPSGMALRRLAPEVVLEGGRLIVSALGGQREVDRALKAALLEGRPGLVTIVTDRAGTLRLLVVPVLGQGLDVFRATAALLVVLDVGRPPRVDEKSLDLLGAAAGLTRRETDATRLVAAGCSPKRCAERLDISYETARLHLRNAYAKLGVHGQVELSALVNRLSRH